MILETIRIIIGLILILFVPGYAMTWALYPGKDDITWEFRIAISFPLSISGVMLSVLFSDIVLGIDTTPSNIVFIIISLTVLTFLFWKLHLYVINKNFHFNAIRIFLINLKKCKEKLISIRNSKRSLKETD